MDMEAYIFDLDGTLLDSMYVWERIDTEFLAKRGIDVPRGYADAISSMTFAEAAAYTIKTFSLKDSVESLLLEWNSMAFFAYGHTIEMKPYAKDYLLSLRRRGSRLAVATSLSPGLREPRLKSTA